MSRDHWRILGIGLWIGLVLLIFQFACSYRANAAPFAERWPVSLLPQESRVRTIPIRNESPPQEPDAGEIPLPRERPQMRKIPRPIANICQRHGMRKVHYGKRWRCRR